MSSENIKPLIATYKKLFFLLSAITLIGIGLVLLHVPVWLVLLAGFSFIAIKSVIVYNSFKNLLTGKNGLIVLFALTVIFLIAVLSLPFLTEKGSLVGSQDISKQLMMEQQGGASEKKDAPAKEEHHGH